MINKMVLIINIYRKGQASFARATLHRRSMSDDICTHKYVAHICDIMWKHVSSHLPQHLTRFLSYFAFTTNSCTVYAFPLQMV